MRQQVGRPRGLDCCFDPSPSAVLPPCMRCNTTVRSCLVLVHMLSSCALSALQVFQARCDLLAFWTAPLDHVVAERQSLLDSVILHYFCPRFCWQILNRIAGLGLPRFGRLLEIAKRLCEPDALLEPHVKRSGGLHVLCRPT